MRGGGSAGVLSHVLDASALLALFRGEVAPSNVPIVGAAVSAVNWSEVVQKMVQHGGAIDGLHADVVAQGLVVLDFTPGRAEGAAVLWGPTRALGLSLGDRACLALAHELGLPALTADRAWRHLDVGVEVVLVR